MEFTGEYRIPAPRQAVWQALNDPEALRQSIPGCEEIELTAENELTATVMVKVGPVKARFKGKVTLSDLDPPNSYRISGEGQGGPAGFAKGGATVTLTDSGDGGTVLTYVAEATVGGKMAQIGSRLIDGVARKMADDFFSAFSKIAGGGAPAESEPEQEATDSAGLPQSVWITGVIALVLLSLWFYSRI